MYQGKHNDRFWLVKDTAGHAGSQYKVYHESGGFSGGARGGQGGANAPPKLFSAPPFCPPSS